MFSTFHVFPLPPRKEIQLLSRFLCCVLFIWVLVEESVTTNGGFIDGFFYSSCRLLQQSEEKTKAFLTSLTSFQELHLMWVWVIAFFVSFNEHNYFNFLTVTRTINLRRCMAPDLKYTSFLKTGRSFFENLICLVVKRRLYVGYVLLVFAFQMRSRLKYKQRKNKALKEILISATLQSNYFLHLMKSAFASRHFSCFDNVSQEFCILLFGFCFFWFL